MRTVKIFGIRVDFQPAASTSTTLSMNEIAALYLDPFLSTPGRGHELHGYLREFARRIGHTADELTGPRGSAELVEARRQFAQAAKRAGFSTPAIGRALHRHHTSVLHLLKK